MKASKALTPRSIMNQKRAVESRGSAKARTPGGADENKKPVSGATPVTPTSSNLWKAHTSRRDATTPLGVSSKANRKAGNGTPTTPSRHLPGKPQRTPTRENLLITPCNNEGGVSFCHTSTVQMEPTPKSALGSSRAFNRSRSASSLVRSRKGGGSTKMRRSVSEARLPADNSQASNDTAGGELSRLSVGVRVRPLQQREHGNTILVEGNEVKVASELGTRHSFVLDHVFGSGTTQSEVYNSMVKPLVDSAFEGYNACLFAYGQTGSGKTYSMMGSKTVVGEICEFTGIIPRFCHELIDRVSNVNNESGGDSIHTSITVEVSYLEVYNEKIRDLLVTPPSKNLRVREHPVYGPYVADISKHSVNTSNEIQHWISEGNKQRAIAATEMNDKSSRSHSLFMVILTQSVVESDEGEGWTHESTRRSQINLVDLAGSERIAHSSVSSDRLREGVSINRSLMTLGKVISALVDKRSFVPYRESVLTWLLKESLGGNSRTAMLATVSPCSSHQDETLATLRYAAQARTILNTVRINESPQNRIIRELRAEIERLREEHGFSPSREMSPAGDMHPEHVLHLETEINALQSRLEEAKAQLVQTERARDEAEARAGKATEEASKMEENCTKEMEKLNQEYVGLKTKFLEFTKEHEKYLISCTEKDVTVEAFKRRTKAAENDKMAILSKLEVAENEVKRLSELVQEHLDQKSLWTNKIESMEKSVLQWQNDLKRRESVEDKLRTRAEEAESKIVDLLKRLDDEKEQPDKFKLFEEQAEALRRKIASVEAESNNLSKALDRERKEKESLIKDLEESKRKLEETEKEGMSWAKSLELKETEVIELTKKIETMTEQLAETSGELEDAKETLRTISVQVDQCADKISVSVQTVSVQPCYSVAGLDTPDQSPMSGEVSVVTTPDQTREYARLKKKIMEKRKKLESLNAKLIKCDSENGVNDTHMSAMLEANIKMKELEETVKKQKSDIEEMSSELELLRELETKYKNKLDQSLQDSEEAWNKKYVCVCEKLDVANNELSDLRKQLKDSQEHVKSLIDQLSKSNLEKQVLVGEDVCERLGEITCSLEKRNTDLQLKLDQKNNLILELERVANRAKEELVATQTYANELKRQYEILDSNFKEAKKINQENEDKVEEFESRIRTFEDELKDSKRKAQDREVKLNQASDRTADLERSIKERDERLVELHGQLVSLQKLLQETMTMKLNSLKSMNENEALKKDELESKDIIAVENLRLKSDLESTVEQLNRKKKRLEKMKSHVDKLEEILITTMRQSVERKNYMLIKAEHSKMFDCMMEHSYLFHWEYLLRKARSYAHKYHIPYEFERFDEATAVVRHLLYNAKSYWFRIDFKLWFENIEKNDRWNKELDESLPWEVDFGNYYNIPDEKRGALCPLDESACQDVEPYCCKPGLICPGVWKRTIVHRHLSGLMDDTRCLLVYFDSSKNQDIKDFLNIINNVAEQIRDLLSTKP